MDRRQIDQKTSSPCDRKRSLELNIQSNTCMPGDELFAFDLILIYMLNAHPQRLAQVRILDVLPPEANGAAAAEAVVALILVQKVAHNDVRDDVPAGKDQTNQKMHIRWNITLAVSGAP